MTKKKISSSKSLTKEQACKIFKAAFVCGTVIYTNHSKERMMEYEVDANDLLALSKSGFVLNSPELHPKTGAWNYRIEHPTETLKVVFEVIDKKKIKIRLITVIGNNQ